MAAHEHFRQFGYEKTTVGNIAKTVGVSAAYVYKFFESKQAIGNAICRLSLEDIARDVKTVVESQISAHERIRLIFFALSSHARELSLRESRLCEMISFAWQERWQAIEGYETSLEVLIRQLVEEGRRSGEFERNTPLEETCRSILISLETLRNPVLWTQRVDTLDDEAHSLAALVLRSLAP